MPAPRRTGTHVGASFNINSVGRGKNSPRSGANSIDEYGEDRGRPNSRPTRHLSPRAAGGGAARAPAGKHVVTSGALKPPDAGSIPGVRELLVQHLSAARQDLAQRTQLALEQMEHACVDSLHVLEASSLQLRRENERLCAENERLHAHLAENERLHVQFGTSGGHSGGTGETPALRGGTAPRTLPDGPRETSAPGKTSRAVSADSAVMPPVQKRPPTPSCSEGPPTMNIPGLVHNDVDRISQIEVTSEDEDDLKMYRGDADSMGGMEKNKTGVDDDEEGDDEEESGGKKKGRRRRSVFVDADKMKAKVREAVMKKQYNVHDCYHEKGIMAAIAKSNAFDYLTLMIILVNAVWIMVDLDYNHAEFILDAEPIFQIAEFSFCVYFTLEIIIRFLAFKRKKDCLSDAWFIFDSILVVTMLFDTGLITLLMWLNGGGSANGSMAFADPTILKMFRMLKITRVTRMLRLLRATPELMILIKGIVVAFRSVLFTLALLMIFIYLFAILFKSLLADSPQIREQLFPNVLTGMLNLLLQGTLPDHEALVMQLWDESAAYGLLAIFFILMTSLTVMNMLVGVLVEVVGVVSTVEKEQMNVQFVYSKLQELLTTSGLDADNDNRISKAEFESLLLNPKAARMVQEVGVDVVGLVDFSEYLFQNGATLSFPEFMDLVLQLRGSNTATVKDVVDLRKFICSQVMEINDTIHQAVGIPKSKGSPTREFAIRAEEALSRPETGVANTSPQWAAPRPPSGPTQGNGGGGGGVLFGFESIWASGGDKQGGTQLLDEEV